MVTAKDHLLARLYDNEVDLVETIHYPYIYFSENSGLRPFIDNVFMQQNWYRISPATSMKILRWRGWLASTMALRLCRGSPHWQIITCAF